jgi:hypothetical protein
MNLIGTIVRLQVQRSSLKLGQRPRRWFDPAPLLEVPALSLSADGVVGLAEGGGEVIDVHNREHPYTRHGTGNGLSIGFTSHYARMRERFGKVVVHGLAGENILVETERAFCGADLPAELVLETGGGLVHLRGARVIEPCVEFSRYALGFRGASSHDLPTPADHDAADLTGNEPAAPGKPDPRVKETLVFLRKGMRGYCATYASGPTAVRVGDRLFAAWD